jgi:hypothetical protein
MSAPGIRDLGQTMMIRIRYWKVAQFEKLAETSVTLCRDEGLELRFYIRT